MNLNGGYAMIKYNSTQEELAVAYKTKRPILLYDEDKRAHWVQINEKEVETIDEETQETIITYEYSYQLLNDIEALVDSKGNPRFIEGEGEPATIEGFTSTYCKWSLSGTHLMLVLSGSFADTTVMPAIEWVKFFIPKWILDKIYIVWSNRIERKNIDLTASNYTVQNLAVYLGKQGNYLFITAPTITLTAERFFRIQFDLLIDNE